MSSALSGAVHGKFLWFNGKIVPWEEGKIHMSAPKYWSIVDALRAYPSAIEPNESYIIRFDDHMKRWYKDLRFYGIPVKYTADDIRQATIEVTKANDFHGDVHYILEATMANSNPPFEAHVAIMPRSNPTHLPPSPTFQARKAIVSSWRRISPDSMPPDVKCWANYGNSALATLEAMKQGADMAIFLDHRGFVSEFTRACLVAVKHGKIVTPPTYASILDGLTRASLLTFAADLGLETEERDITRYQLYGMDEVFAIGSGAEIIPFKEIDGFTIGIGDTGPITKQVGTYYHDIVSGKVEKYRSWLLPVYKQVTPQIKV